MWLRKSRWQRCGFSKQHQDKKGKDGTIHLQYGVTNSQQGRTMPIYTVQLALGISGLSGDLHEGSAA